MQCALSSGGYSLWSAKPEVSMDGMIVDWHSSDLQQQLVLVGFTVTSGAAKFAFGENAR